MISSDTDVVAPPNAEGTRATILRWCKLVGESVVKDEPLLELETDKVTVEVAAPASGTLIEVLKPANAEVIPDEVLARLRPIAEASAGHEPAPRAAALEAQKPEFGSKLGDGPGSISPAVRRLLLEHAIEASDVAGTGRDGRITVQDVERHIALVPAHSQIPHSAIRRRIAEHMVRSLAEAPHVTTVFEADLTKVLEHRSKHAANFESRGARLTLTVYFINACVRALRAFPEVNATFLKDALELHADVNIGVGTALGNKGLIVPVIHQAQSLSLFDTARRLAHLVETARLGKLSPEEVRGGTFTISNHGVSGSLLAAPIVINQPQVAILGVGRVQRRVCVVSVGEVENIAIRSMCYLTLTIDHRALDAFQANAFLSMIVKILEEWPEAQS
jgi:2-oxoglutarate dehydrogenase E2 component (dihydrolipoamide succinyltransferase)